MNLKNARILISNDDGVGAEGIAVLEQAARELSDDVWVVAPAHEQSGAGHSLSLHVPLRYQQVAERRFAVYGTPTDAVLLGVQEILRDRRPDLVLSGVNRGSNLAEDVTYSGTVAAAMEATLLDIPAIAFSNMRSGDAIDWRTPREFICDIVRKLTRAPWPSGVLMNVNFPHLPPEHIKGIRACAHGRRKLEDNLDRRFDPQGRPYIWIGGQRSEPFSDDKEVDFELIKRGYITVTPLQMDMTNYPLLDNLRNIVE